MAEGFQRRTCQRSFAAFDVATCAAGQAESSKVALVQPRASPGPAFQPGPVATFSSEPSAKRTWSTAARVERRPKRCVTAIATPLRPGRSASVTPICVRRDRLQPAWVSPVARPFT